MSEQIAVIVGFANWFFSDEIGTETFCHLNLCAEELEIFQRVAKLANRLFDTFDKFELAKLAIWSGATLEDAKTAAREHFLRLQHARLGNSVLCPEDRKQYEEDFRVFNYQMDRQTARNKVFCYKEFFLFEQANRDTKDLAIELFKEFKKLSCVREGVFAARPRSDAKGFEATQISNEKMRIIHESSPNFSEMTVEEFSAYVSK